jgi:AcrR family transcriptional regulator
MEVARLTQAQRRARTRDRLFRATLEVVAERGIAAVSTRRVARAAGLSYGAIYAHFDSVDDLLHGALAYYRAHVPELDVPDARSVRELLRGRLRVLLQMTDARDAALDTIRALQVELTRAEDPALRALYAEWEEARIAQVAARIEEVAEAAGERLLVEPPTLAARGIALCQAFRELRREHPDFGRDEVAFAATDALAASAVAPVRRRSRTAPNPEVSARPPVPFDPKQSALEAAPYGRSGGCRRRSGRTVSGGIEALVPSEPVGDARSCGVRFSDGSPLTPEDVAYSLGRNLDRKLGSQIGVFYANVKSVRVSGAHEVTVFLKKPDISVASTVPQAVHVPRLQRHVLLHPVDLRHHGGMTNVERSNA